MENKEHDVKCDIDENRIDECLDSDSGHSHCQDEGNKINDSIDVKEASSSTPTSKQCTSISIDSRTGTCPGNFTRHENVNITSFIEPLETTTLFPNVAVASEPELLLQPPQDMLQQEQQRDETMTLLQEIDDENEINNMSTTFGVTSQPQLRSATYTPNYILYNFIFLSILFSANHGAVVSCLSLATARLGELGSWQSSVLYSSYTLSALFGATAIVKTMGPRNSIQLGMWIYCIYVACFVVATAVPSGQVRARQIVALAGALVGGVGGGFLWTAQGSYFSRASGEYAKAKGLSLQDSTSLLGGIFAGIYLGEEVLLRLLSSLIIHVGYSWVVVFVLYTLIAIGAALLMVFSVDYPPTDEERIKNASQSTFYKSTVTFRLLVSDPKMKYMMPLCGAFSLSSVFIGTFVNAEVIRLALGDTDSAYVGFLTSITSAVGGTMSIVFGLAARKVGNGSILAIGCLSFFTIVSCFLLRPDLSRWNLASLIFIYCCQGIGRATFEGTLKAEFANVFEDKEAAFGNVIFQSGFVTTLGFAIAADANIGCTEESNYCIKYEDGKLHNTLVLELLIAVSSILAVAGYHRAKYLYKQEQRAQHELESRLLGDDHLL